MSQLDRYLSRMTPDNVWPAGHDPAEAAAQIGHVVDPESLVLRWNTNNQCPMDDMLAAWVVLEVITMEQARATSVVRAEETGRFLTAYRENPPAVTAEHFAEMCAAFGPGETIIDVISGQTWTT
jgi:hypothetical protein